MPVMQHNDKWYRIDVEEAFTTILDNSGFMPGLPGAIPTKLGESGIYHGVWAEVESGRGGVCTKERNTEKTALLDAIDAVRAL
jgi:hypothetical protein